MIGGLETIGSAGLAEQVAEMGDGGGLFDFQKGWRWKCGNSAAAIELPIQGDYDGGKNFLHLFLIMCCRLLDICNIHLIFFLWCHCLRSGYAFNHLP